MFCYYKYIMDCILDTCSIIYLSKIKDLDIIFLLFDNLLITNYILDELLYSNKPRSEYKYLYSFLSKFSSNIEMIDIESNDGFKSINKFIGGKGESSIFKTCKLNKNLISVTSDKKAHHKFVKNNVLVLKTYEIYKLLYFKKMISKKKFIKKINLLKSIGGISEKECGQEIELLNKI